ncbi:hypothetical protein PHLGIDRAFT_17052 [Phlebiopsis gigantea 11061_1 CR5-6]|uniref:Uncharacterized protein n=1 Tax=Phlebiopsis gigantea (strain 11061_1 CR5-6) TaxID=745531 RepID=A0A0C3PA67_PHLG1|nr:hypothetical protein PHLGIDRAFT_17052 [Phlebiopsis gigantea 11061_1 CR5-6]
MARPLGLLVGPGTLQSIEKRRKITYRKIAQALTPHTPPGMSSVEYLLKNWRKSAVNMDYIEHVDRALADRAEGDWEAIHVSKANLHTTMRKWEFVEWREVWRIDIDAGAANEGKLPGPWGLFRQNYHELNGRHAAVNHDFSLGLFSSPISHYLC